MPKAVMVVLSRPASEAHEAEYERWYDEQHVPDLLRVPGITSARRFELSESQLRDSDVGGRRFLAIYEIEADDLGAVVAAIRERQASGEIVMSDAFEMDPPPLTLVFEERDAPWSD